MDEMCQNNGQIVALGTGEEKYENMFPPLCMEVSGQGIRGEHLLFQAMSHKIYAPVMHFLMPSLFEPCGLSS